MLTERPSSPLPTPEAQPPVAFQPSAEQLARADALRRFNWLYIYTPLIMLAVVTVSLVFWLTWGMLFATELGISQMRERVSAVADLIIIALTLPATLMCLLLPGLGIALLVHDREREMTRIAWLRTWLWRLDSLVAQVRDKTAENAPKVAGQVVQFNGRVSYFRALLWRIRQILTGK